MCPKQITHNSVEFRLVGVHPDTHIAFYVNNGQGGVQGLQVLPNGIRRLKNATPCTNANSKYNGFRKQHYLQFKDAWGHHRHINASHAVYTAWRNEPIPKGMTIDHINGCATNNDYRNLRCVTSEINSRDGGFLRKLRHKGIDPTTIQRPILLRYYSRMAKFKETHTRHQYDNLTKCDLIHILYDNEI